MQERLQKIISTAGVASRRAAEDLIVEGRVRVNGKVVSELGAKADAAHDHIKVDGKLINPVQPRAYVMLNKPTGYVTTMSDPEGRPVVSDLLKGVKARVYPVGRLDYNTEGLLLLTSDGDFAHLITHPKHELPKTYLVKIKGVLTDANIEALQRGVFLKDGKTAPAKVKKLRKEEANSWVEITIHEGKKRQVRRMIDYTGHSVIKLKRVRIGGLNLGNLPTGAYRHLTVEEVNGLKESSMREQKDTFSAPRTEARPPQPAAGPAKRRPEQQTERGPAPEIGQRAPDSWATKTGKRRRSERERSSGSSAPKRYIRDASSASAGDRKPRIGDREKGSFARVPQRDRERSSSGPSWGRKPGIDDRGKGPFTRGPHQDRERRSSGPSWEKKPGFGNREKGSFSRSPQQDRERGASAADRKTRSVSREQNAGSFPHRSQQGRSRDASARSRGNTQGRGAGSYAGAGGPRKGGTGPRGPQRTANRKPRGRKG